jgi:hypothetical protein
LYNYIKFQTKTFNKKKYLESINEKLLPFYTQVVETSLFERFTSDLISNYSQQKKDYFYEKLQTMKRLLSEHHIDSQDDKKSRSLQRARASSVSAYSKPLAMQFEIKDTFATKNITRLNRELEVSLIKEKY